MGWCNKHETEVARREQERGFLDWERPGPACPLCYDELERQRDRLRNALKGMWHQFAETAPDGTRHTGGLSALEDAADALGIETA